MGNDGKQPGLSSTGILWLVLLGAGALFLREVPWQGSRPAGVELKRYTKAAYQDVDARLWQDPMGAVAQAREEERKREASDSKLGAVAQAREEERKREASDSKSKAAPERPEDSRRGASHVPSALFCAREDDRHRKSKDMLDKDVLVIGAMVSGAPYPERTEFRRRARYAILAGLNQAGFVPEDEEHLGYIHPERSREAGNPAEKPLPEFIAYEWLVPVEANLPGHAARAFARSRREESVLVLWLDEDSFGDNPNDKIQSVAASLLMCPGKDGTGPEKVPHSQFVVLGPSATWPLQAMLAKAMAKETKDEPKRDEAKKDEAKKDEAKKDEAKKDEQKIPLVFYAFGATAADAGLLAEAGVEAKYRPKSVNKVLREKSVVLFRTINSDDALADELTRELALRDVKPKQRCERDSEAKCQHVVLIAERDSFYGRSLPWTVAGKLVDPAGTALGDIDDYPSWIHAYSYLRGLDGQLPTPTDSNSGKKEEGDAKPGAPSGGNDAKRIERPDGQSQYDYLRRLSDQLVALDSDLRARNKGSIRAIGVLGSDVYDKLLILQALRAQFPNAIVFTTDAEAIYQHPQQLPWTHNAIIASSFGQRLDSSLQRDIPPFRGSYQTSLFLSSMIAVSNARFRASPEAEACPNIYTPRDRECWSINQKKIMRWLSAPRLFEVGRTKAFDFSRAPMPVEDMDGDSAPGFRAVALRPRTLPCSPHELATCAVIHPSSTAMYPEPAARWIQGGFLIVVGALLLGGLANGTVSRVAAWVAAGAVSISQRRLRRSIAVPVALLGLALIVVAYLGLAPLWHVLANATTQGHDGEPIVLIQGVSIWPTVLIRLIATGLSIWFICRSWRALNANLDDIARSFKWQAPREVLERQQREEQSEWSIWQRALRMFSYRLDGQKPGPVSPATGLTASAEKFWGKYMYQGRWWARFWRVLLATVAYMAVAMFIVRLMEPAVSPYRGTLAAHLEPALRHLAVFATLFLIFFVVDATVFCYQLVSELRKKLPAHDDTAPEVAPGERAETRWPKATLEKYAAKLGLDERYLDDWITMHFVARRTQAVARLVYYPFIVIALMVLSRSSLFDNWTTPIGLVIVVTFSVAIVMACAILLRLAAERLRRRAIWRLTNAKVKLKAQGPADSRVAEQIDVMITQIRAFDTGAFAPYSQQPIVRALLLPLTSYGGAALVEYLSIANF
jgi:hypothetical protein